MSFSKVLASGEAGSVTLAEAGADFSLAVQGSLSLGGGSVAGVAKAKFSAEVDLGGKELLDAGLLWAEGKVPAAAPIIASLKAIMDAELPQV